MWWRGGSDPGSCGLSSYAWRTWYLLPDESRRKGNTVQHLNGRQVGGFVWLAARAAAAGPAWGCIVRRVAKATQSRKTRLVSVCMLLRDLPALAWWSACHWSLSSSWFVMRRGESHECCGCTASNLPGDTCECTPTGLYSTQRAPHHRLSVHLSFFCAGTRGW